MGILLVVSGCARPAPARGTRIEVASVASGVPSSAPSAPVAPATADGRFAYEGTIAGKPVLLRLRCHGGACHGQYVYEAIGEALQLRGDGRQLEESVGAAERIEITGQLAFEQPPGAERWQGAWRAQVDSEPKPIALRRVVVGTPRVLARSFEDAIVEDDCHVRIRSVELIGLADEALEDRINAALDPERRAAEHAAPADQPAPEVCVDDASRCSVSAKGYRILCRDSGGRTGLQLDEEVRVALFDAKLLSLRSEYWFDGGGAHPSDGVRGLTLDLRTGQAIDARDLLKRPEREPTWSSYIPARTGDEEDARVAPLAIGERPREDPLSAWSDFYLTARGIELIPNVPEAARMYRHMVQHVPFSKVRVQLRQDGPASHLLKR